MQLWKCDHCGREGKAPDEVVVMFHRCHPPKGYRRRWTPPDLEGTTLEDVWARVFADAYGGYTPPTPEEAQEETDAKPRRTRGAGFRDEDDL